MAKTKDVTKDTTINIQDIDSINDDQAAKYMKEVLAMANSNQEKMEQGLNQEQVVGGLKTIGKYTGAAAVGGGITYLAMKKFGGSKDAGDIVEGLKAVGSIAKKFFK